MHYQLHFHRFWIIYATISPFLFLTLQILPVSPLREQMKKYHFSLLCLPCLPSILFLLPCLKHGCFSQLFKLSTSLRGCLMFLCALHPLLCLLTCYSIKVPALTLLTCFCASQQNCPWTQHTSHPITFLPCTEQSLQLLVGVLLCPRPISNLSGVLFF